MLKYLPQYFLLSVFLVGCSSAGGRAGAPLLTGTNPEGAPLCFEERSKIPSFFESFYATRDLSTEEGKIDYLIERVSRSGLVFTRNGVDFGSYATAQFLRWKLDRLRAKHKIEVNSVNDFVEKIGSGSRTTGKPYEVEIPHGGGRHNLRFILQNELAVLNNCLEKEQMREAGTQESIAQVTEAAASNPATEITQSTGAMPKAASGLPGNLAD